MPGEWRFFLQNSVPTLQGALEAYLCLRFYYYHQFNLFIKIQIIITSIFKVTNGSNSLNIKKGLVKEFTKLNN
jgi:hypothetical protein